MSKKKTRKQRVAEEKQEEKLTQVDKQICELADDLRDKGLKDDILIVAVAKIYANSLLLAYKESLDTT